MNEEQLKQYGRVVARCWADPDFKARLIADPAATLAAEEGLTLPPGIEARVLENTATLWHLVLPMPPSESELSDEALDQVAGGGGAPCASA